MSGKSLEACRAVLEFWDTASPSIQIDIAFMARPALWNPDRDEPWFVTRAREALGQSADGAVSCTCHSYAGERPAAPGCPVHDPQLAISAKSMARLNAAVKAGHIRAGDEPLPSETSDH